jgi:two-component system, OmpR family, sensor histidine kinase KdpD
VSRGRLRVYLGMAPGVGKTYAMLDEGKRRLDRGTDVVVGVVETHGRAHTAERLQGLEVVPRQRLSYRGATFEEMDLDAVLARRPAVALVDELAHSNVPGSRYEKRWQDVDTLLDAGIDVITTVNIQHLESLNDVVQRISGVEQRETIPDEVVRRADQIEIVDIAPEALRRRMAHGNIYPSDRVDAALSNYFRVGNLSALRELALLWIAERVDEGLQRYRAAHGIEQPWEARERIVVALPGGPEGETLLRRAVRIATRTTGADLLALHVVKGDGLATTDPAEVGRQRQLAESMGGSWHQVVGDDVATAILDFARVENATQIVLGASSRGRWEAFLAGEGIGARVTRLSEKIDVHLVSHEAASAPGFGASLPVAGLTTALSVRRRVHGAAAALVLLPLLTFVLSRVRSELNLPSDILLYLGVVIVVALIGGLWPALGAAVAGSLLLNYYFTPPLYTFTISDKNNALALLVFVAVGALVSVLVERVVRRTTEASRASAEAAVLAGLAGGILRGETSLPQILGRARETFGLQALTLLERSDTSGAWQEIDHVGEPGGRMDTTEVPVGERLLLRVEGQVRAADQRLLAAFAAQAAAVWERDRLTSRAEEATLVEEADRTRSALLAAVSHDLRSPLASAKASVTSLRSDRVQWTPAAQAELLATADESLDRLTRLIENLLDMSRLEAGALGVSLGAVALDELVPLVLDALGADASRVRVKVPETLPEVRADAVLLERVLVNLLGNALRYSPPSSPPLVAASCHAGTMEIRVVDRGPGVPETQSDQLFAPFQRLGDRDNTTGVGLGLALSRGLTEAMGGTLTAEDTPGGGLTMAITLPLVEDLGGTAVQRGELPFEQAGQGDP